MTWNWVRRVPIRSTRADVTRCNDGLHHRTAPRFFHLSASTTSRSPRRREFNSRLEAASRWPRPRSSFAHVPDDAPPSRKGILATTTDEGKAIALIAAMDATPLQDVRSAITGPLLTLIAAFSPSAEDAPHSAPTGAPVLWPEVFRTLYRRATGWLGWTPETAWNATPAEISEAHAGWIEMQTALHGSPDDEDKPADTDTLERLAEIDAQGFDPAFDREGLRALQASAGKRV